MANTVYTTTKQGGLVLEQSEDNLIILTEDRVRVLLMEHLARVEARGSWATPASVFATLLTALIASTFNRDALGIKAAVWEAIFWLATVASVGWFIYSVFRAMANSAELSDIIKALKSDTAKSKAQVQKPSSSPRPD